MSKAFITGCAGPQLSPCERSFLGDERPWGLILFGRNCETPQQVRDLVADFRACVGVADAPVLIDQEGGRVRRLRPPHWPDYPAGAVYGAVHQLDRQAGCRAAWLGGRLMGADLADLGITVDCLPIVDLPTPETSDAIGNRAYGHTVEAIVEIGRGLSDGLAAAGVLPVLKHIPGHGRARVDSHLELPVVDAPAEDLSAMDFEPFRRLRDLPMAMTAHVVYSALDPERCATRSSLVIETVIRGDIGFDGLLMSDDVSMKALGGDMGGRIRDLFAAGCDMALHCNGDFAEMRAVAGNSPELAGRAAERANAARAARPMPEAPFDRAEFRAEFDALLERAGVQPQAV